MIAAAGTHLKIFSGGAMRPLIVELVPLFERAHDTIVHVGFRLTSALKQAIEAGATFDLAIMPRPDLDELIARSTVAPGTACEIAHSSVGLAVRTGASKPDIGSVAALRQALLQARSLAYSDGPSGAYVAGLLTKLGIAEEVGSKSKLTSRPVAELVARGEAEIGMQQIVAILPVKGVWWDRCRPSYKMSLHMLPQGFRCARGTPRPRRSLRSPGAKRRNDLCVRWGWSQRDPKQSPALGYGIAGIRGNACAIALLCPYRLDLGRWRRYIPPTFRQAVSFASRNGLPGSA